MRPSWNQYFMDIARLVSSRSTCLRRKVGAVLVQDKQIIATGYNGAPTNLAHCESVGCLRSEKKIPSGMRHEICRGIHAETNVLLQAALHGVQTKGATLYCTHQPCILCAKMIINGGITHVYYQGEYPDSLAQDLLKEAGIVLMLWIEEES